MAQCTISAPKNICLGNLGYFNISTPSGSKVVSAVWDFGDGYTAKFQNTGHLYKKTGIFRVKCKLSLKDGNSCIDSVYVTVLELPKADFLFSKLNPCLPKNEICLDDQSKAASSFQSIATKLVIWDDGTFDKIGSSGCHKYKQEGTYKITLEATDAMGCKNIKSREITIIPGPLADYSLSTTSYCGGKKVCIKNSSNIYSSSANIFFWEFDNAPAITAPFDSVFCFTYLQNKNLKVNLSVNSSNGCRDSLSKLHSILVDNIPSVQIVLSDTSVCYKTKVKARIEPSGNYKFLWNFENSTIPQIEIDTRIKGNIGSNLLKCKVTKGDCSVDLEANYTIRGPVANIKIFNKIQCGVSRKVFFIDSTKVTDYNKSSRFWILDDFYGDSCISYRAKNINKNQNCNYSKDWYHKHRYTINNPNNAVDFYVYDSITQCGDTLREVVITDACDGDGYCVGKGTLCPGDYITANPNSSIKPIKFSLDSGKTWFNFPWKVLKGYKGWYSLLIAYNIDSSYVSDLGDDSIKIYSDTSRSFSYLYLKNHIFINEGPNAEFTYTMSKDCKVNDVFIHLADTLVKANESITIDWGDKTSTTFKPTKDTIYDTIKHRYYTKLFKDTIRIFRILPNGCKDKYKLPIKFGTMVSLDSLPNICFGETVCFGVSVVDFGDDMPWSSTHDYGKIKLLTGDGKEFTDDYAPCYKYPDYGKKRITLIATSKNGCSDTLYREMNVSGVLANITNASRLFGCGEIKQLFDSSTVLPINNSDPITDYLWDFGKKNNLSIEKDPYHAFSKFGTFTVIHSVKTQTGCTDSVKFTVMVAGPQPYFDIVDTIGCEPFTVTLKNRSKHSSQYYWNFGDPEQSTYLNSDTGDVLFTYTSAGKYYINLTGIDTFFSSTTQTLYFCNDTFPKISTSRSVTVLPFLNAGFDSDDTLCMNTTFSIQNLSDSRYGFLNWDFGDGTKKITSNIPEIKYKYTATGSYKIILIPDYIVQSGIPKCLDTAEKTISVMGTLANFEYERLCDNSPLVNFKNTTLPDDSTLRYTWDFGQSNLPDNESKEKNPHHDYGFNNGDFEICLSLVDQYGCMDTICQIIENDFTSRFKIPNVFTPGDIDGKNDEYDILMEGEEIYDLSIFSRWGLLMYHSQTDGVRGDGTNWNGRFDNTGVPCPEGTYFYIFEYKNCYGDLEKKRTSGTITLIR